MYNNKMEVVDMFNFFNRNKDIDLRVNDIDDVIGNIEIIDVREPYEFKARALKGARNIPMQTLLRNPEKYLNKDKQYYLICQSGSRSSMCSRKLRTDGYSVINVAGGMGKYTGVNLR